MNQSSIHKTMCKKVEEYLLLGCHDSLSGKENKKIEAHLKSCPECSAYAEMLEKIKNTLEAESRFNPDPNIQRELIKRLKSRTSVPVSIYSEIFTRIKDVFQYRIPVYQIALAGIIFFFAIIIGDASFPATTQSTSGVAGFDTSGNMINLNFIERQSGVKGIKADTILTKFIKSTI